MPRRFATPAVTLVTTLALLGGSALLGGCGRGAGAPPPAPGEVGPGVVTGSGGVTGSGIVTRSGSAGPGPGSAGGLLGALPPGSGLVATAGAAGVRVLRSPGGALRANLDGTTPDGGPLVLRVIGESDRWLQVQLPVRPNGATGWVAQDQVTLAVTPYRLVVHRDRDRRAHRLEVWREGRRVAVHPVGIGTSVNPTPTGTYYLTELLATGEPGGAYGPYAFGLSAFSATLTSFAGGPGQLGLHGTDRPDLVGTDVSHGCLRVTNEVITALAGELPLGTPIEIRP